MGSVTVDLGRAKAELDLDRRVKEIPAWAAVRGVFFNMIEEDLKRRGLRDELSWSQPQGGPRRSYLLYPVRDFLSVYAQAGALVDADSREGVRAIFGSGSRFFGASLLGRTFQRLLRPDPTAALLWLERSREHICNYGRWRVEQRGPGHVVLHMFDEYVWIDTAHRGGCEGMLEACGVVGEVHAELDTPFRGRLDVRWKQRS